ncbi:MAG: PepSY domain-containing protein [Candidatus Dadabacteria bacterium]|nr:PepSY domain-containing protein [Candidatus Dadabacteria bacterium]
MRHFVSLFVIAFAVAFFAAAGTSYADRDATPEETAKVTEALNAMGCTSFKEVDVDDNNVYEVEDVICEDGKYDIDLDMQLNVIKKEKD